ncbi:MAG: phosphate ABC transporter substrate-binding protein [Planctomycetaceae bacterium]|nr:phosphate ABC transporter substrate-binding protein [Planctomycetaceae bacterium]
MALRMTQAPPAPQHKRPRPKVPVAAALTVVLVLLLVLGLIWGAGGFRKTRGKTVTLIGSTSVEPFAELLAENFDQGHSDISVEVQGGGSTAGIQALTSGLADIGMCSRSLSKEEQQTMTPIVIARDGLAVIVNESNPIDTLTEEQIRSLFAGDVTNWKQLGGSDSPVNLIMREEGSGTREAFMNLVMRGRETALRALVQESNGAVKELVRTDPAGVGYMSLGLVGTEVKAVKIKGVEATSENVRRGTYTLVRPFLFVVRRRVGEATSQGAAASTRANSPLAAAAGLTPQAKTLIEYVLSPPGQAVLESQGLVAAQ